MDTNLPLLSPLPCSYIKMILKGLNIVNENWPFFPPLKEIECYKSYWHSKHHVEIMCEKLM